jgi:hypothetical protein
MNAESESETRDPVFCDFSELAELDPELALDLLIWLFMDDEVAAERYAFYTALARTATTKGRPEGVEDFAVELDAIRELGVLHAVKDRGVSIRRLALMSEIPEVIVATYEAFTGEPAPWVKTEGIVVRLKEMPVQPKLFGSPYVIPNPLIGGGADPASKHTGSSGLPAGDCFGPSADLRYFLVSVPQDDVGDRCPFSIIVAECQSESRTHRRIVVLRPSLQSANLVGSIKVSDLLPAGRTAFNPGDRMNAYWVSSAADLTTLGLNADDLDEILSHDSQISSSEVRERLLALRTELERKSDE